MNLTELVEVLQARRKLAAIVLGAVAALIIVTSLVLPKTYVAEVDLVVDSKGRDPLTGMILPSQLLPSSLGTQVDVIASRNVALRVVDKYKLTQIAEVQAQFRSATGGNGSIREWTAEALLDKLDVRPSRESNVVNIRFSAADPNFAAELANAFAEAYIQTSLELNMDPARRQSAWFDQQLQQMRQALEASQDRLSEYQRLHNVVGNDDRLDVESGGLAEMSSQLVAAQAAMYDAQTRQKQMNNALARGNLEQLPDILGNGLLQSMKADLTRAESKLAEAAERLGKNHPQYRSSLAEVRTLRKRLAAELVTAKGSINQAAQIAQQRTVESRAALEQQKTRILELRGQHDGVNVLAQEVHNSQFAYDAALQRASQLRLESQLDQSAVAVLNPAIVPSEAASPKLLLNAFIALLLGAALGVGAALVAEALDRRARSAIVITQITGLTVLAEIPGAVVRPKLWHRMQRLRASDILSLQST